MIDERVMIFIDGSNLFATAERLNPPVRVDILKLRDLLIAGRRHVRTFFFGSISTPPRESQLNFLEKLRTFRIEVVTKELKYRGQDPEGRPIFVEKGIDVALVTTMLSMSYGNAFDVAIIVGGDQDYMQAVEEVKRAGKRVEIAFFGHATGREFRYSGDSFLSLDEKIDQIRLRSTE
jgi:uncharacterized LabA/DUF88 family protein